MEDEFTEDSDCKNENWSISRNRRWKQV